MRHFAKYLIALGLLVGFVIPTQVQAAPGITGFTGNDAGTDTSVSGHGVSTGTGNTATGSVELNYVVPNIVAIEIYDINATASGSTLFSGGEVPVASSFLVDSQAQVAADIIATEDEVGVEEDFYINGTVFSSNRTTPAMLMTPGTAGANPETVQLISASDAADTIDVILTGTVGIAGGTEDLTTNAGGVALTTAAFNASNGLAPFHVGGDVDEATVDTTDNAATYVGTITFAITCP